MRNLWLNIGSAAKNVQTPERGRGRPRHNVGRATSPVRLPKTTWKLAKLQSGGFGPSGAIFMKNAELSSSRARPLGAAVAGLRRTRPCHPTPNSEPRTRKIHRRGAEGAKVRNEFELASG